MPCQLPRPNVKAEQLRVQPGDGPKWMTGASYLVIRKIRMVVKTWDRTSLGEQETLIGRTKGSGAPLARSDEFDELDLELKGPECGRPSYRCSGHVCGRDDDLTPRARWASPCSSERVATSPEPSAEVRAARRL